ncbi:hypothetical protein L9F63_005250, partial [Diploptera punctata]
THFVVVVDRHSEACWVSEPGLQMPNSTKYNHQYLIPRTATDDLLWMDINQIIDNLVEFGQSDSEKMLIAILIIRGFVRIFFSLAFNELTLRLMMQCQ